MYAGHVGIALGAHGLRRTVPLWLLIFVSQLPDWADAGVCVAGAQTPVPGMLTHSIPAVGVLAAAAALAYYLMSRDPIGMALVFAVVGSHAMGDFFTGIKPTWPGGPLVGLQLYRKPAVDFILEGAVIFAGWLVYRESFSRERQSSRAVLTVLGALLVTQLVADIVFITAPGLRKC